MKIQIGSIYINRTRKYLFPIIKYYGKDFTKYINSLFKLGVGIGDIITNKCGIHHEKHLFILVDTAASSNVSFGTTLKWLQNHSAYEDDYAFDAVHKGRLHMIVIRVPDECLTSIDKFKTSEFSKMYTKEQILELFDYSTKDPKTAETYKDIQKVLIHDHNYRVDFAKKIEQEFLTEFSFKYVKPDQEFDFPILLQEEFFNVSSEEEE